MSTTFPSQMQPELFGMPTAMAKAAGKVRFAPGQTVAPVPYQERGQVLLAELVPIGGSDYRLVARLQQRWVKLNAETIRKLGLGVSYKTLRRLMDAGFIKGTTVAPRTHIMDLQSYYEHLERCAADPEFWERADHRERFREACLLGSAL